MSIVEGNIVEGKVVRVKPFGAIVLLEGNKQGLVHISQISDSFVQDINEYVAVGELIKVKVLTVDEDNRKIALSMKEITPNELEETEAVVEEIIEEDTPDDNFERLFKDWVKVSNERQANINKRQKRK